MRGLCSSNHRNASTGVLMLFRLVLDLRIFGRLPLHIARTVCATSFVAELLITGSSILRFLFIRRIRFRFLGDANRCSRNDLDYLAVLSCQF